MNVARRGRLGAFYMNLQTSAASLLPSSATPGPVAMMPLATATATESRQARANAAPYASLDTGLNNFGLQGTDAPHWALVMLRELEMQRATTGALAAIVNRLSAMPPSPVRVAALTGRGERKWLLVRPADAASR